MRIRQASKYSPQIGEVLQSFIPTKFRRIVHIYTQDPVFGRKHLEVQTMTITTIWKRKMSQKDEVGRFTKQKKIKKPRERCGHAEYFKFSKTYID